MAKYIDRKAVLSILTAKNAPWNAYERIAALPVADVQPVKHGRWVGQIYANYECSVCGFYETEKPYNYCPNCGADMRGE